VTELPPFYPKALDVVEAVRRLLLVAEASPFTLVPNLAAVRELEVALRTYDEVRHSYEGRDQGRTGALIVNPGSHAR
jgi:hypothetical protein